jgi:hypothetical protein
VDRLRVVLEVGKQRVFATAVDWPGWSRSAKARDGEQAALEALLAYRDRYRLVADRAGAALTSGDPEVVERLPGNATTDFGAPGLVAECERRPVTADDARRRAALVAACWAALDDAAAAAPAALRKGPRGGGRDRDDVVRHVVEAEASYLRQVGLRPTPAERRDPDAYAGYRAQLLELLARPSDGRDLREGGWPPMYAAMRIAWHALDHAWEIEDRH